MDGQTDVQDRHTETDGQTDGHTVMDGQTDVQDRHTVTDGQTEGRNMDDKNNDIASSEDGDRTPPNCKHLLTETEIEDILAAHPQEDRPAVFNMAKARKA